MRAVPRPPFLVPRPLQPDYAHAMNRSLVAFYLPFLSSIDALPAVYPTPAADAVTVTVNVGEAKTSEGQVVVLLFAGAEGFPDNPEQAFRSASAPLRGGTASVDLEVPAGRYAIVAFHDADGNGHIKTNVRGGPHGGVAASNWDGGRPRFARSAIDVSENATTTVNLSLRYL